MSASRSCYTIHGRTLAVEATSIDTASILDHVFKAYRAADDATAELVVTLEPRAGVERPEGTRPAGAAEDGTRFYHLPDGGLLVEVEGLGFGRIDPAGASARVALEVEVPDWVTGHRLVEPVVVELLRTAGLFGIHAGAVERDGRGLLLVGRSGSGKSTTTLALALSGWGFLGDDTCYLDGRSSGPRPTVRARWSDIHLTPESLEALIPESDREHAFLPHSSQKYFMPVAKTRGIDPKTDCLPEWIVFPRVGEERTSTLEEMTPAEVLAEVAHQSLLPGRESASKAHFDALVTLCEGVRGFRLTSGWDLGEVVARIEELTGTAAPR